MSLTIPVGELFEDREGLTSKHPSWEVIDLKHAVKVQNGFPFESNLFNVNRDGVPLIRIRDILNNKSDTFYRGKYDPEFVVKKGDLLVGMDGDFNSSIWKGQDGLLNQRVCRLMVDESILLKKFLFYGIGGYLKKINDNTSSVTVKHLSSNSIKEIPFPLPPLPEQKRIVAKLDNLFAHLDQLKARLQNIPTLLKQFRQAVLTQAVTGKLTEEWRESNAVVETGNRLLERIEKEVIEGSTQKLPRGYKGNEYRIDYDQYDLPDSWALSVVDKIGVVQIGGTPSRSEPSYWNGEINWVSSGEVDNTRIKGTNETITKLGLDNSSVKVLPKGTVLIAMIGEGKTRGQSSILDIEACTNQNVAAIVTNEHFDSEFLWYFMLSSYEKNRGEGRGANQPALNGQKVGAINIPIPPLQEQKEIVRRVESLFAVANRIEASYKTLQEKIDQLPQAILSKAFRGELLNNDIDIELKHYHNKGDNLIIAAQFELK